MAEEYQEHFGEHAYDDEGNYIGAADDAEREAAWAEYYEQYGEDGAPRGRPPTTAEAEADGRGRRRGEPSRAGAEATPAERPDAERRVEPSAGAHHVSLTMPIRTARSTACVRSRALSFS